MYAYDSKLHNKYKDLKMTFRSRFDHVLHASDTPAPCYLSSQYPYTFIAFETYRNSGLSPISDLQPKITPTALPVAEQPFSALFKKVKTRVVLKCCEIRALRHLNGRYTIVEDQ